MSWSMASVSFRMAGVGDWQSLLPDEEIRRLYSQIYPGGISLQQIEGHFGEIITSWQRAGVATIAEQRLVPLCPIITNEDLEILAPWFHDISSCMCQAICRYLAAYRTLAETLLGGTATPKHEVDNLLTILTCADALDVWTFRALRHELIGPHPPRGTAGRFFLWGYAFSAGPRRIFGVTTYGRGETVRLSVLRSRGLDRGRMPALLRQGPALDYLGGLCLPDRLASREHQAPHEIEETVRCLREVGLLEPDEPPRLAIPVLYDPDMEKTTQLHSKVSKDITSDFVAGMSKLQDLISRCSFAQCSSPDVLAMIFHLAYSYAADALVSAGAIPDFPQQAGGEWGVWLRLIQE